MTDGVQTPQARKPRLMIAGEFSSGKSHLINALLGKELLPSNVTSTSLPPIWVIKGEGDGLRVGLDGTVEPLTSLENVDVEQTLFCLLKDTSEYLDHCDLIDTPGNSDPNIPSICWERMLEYADSVVWCSNAVQAWRQSEKSVWKDIDDRLYRDATMVITHADCLVDESAPAKVLRRVRRDASTFFDHFLMSSLIKPEDVAEIQLHLKTTVLPRAELLGKDSLHVTRARRVVPAAAPEAKAEEAAPAAPLVQPRRIRRKSRTEAPVVPTIDVSTADELILKTADEATKETPAPQAEVAAEPTPDVSVPVIEEPVAEAPAEPVAEPAPATAVDADDVLNNVISLFDEDGDADAPQSEAQKLWAEVAGDENPASPAEWERLVLNYITRVDRKFDEMNRLIGKDASAVANSQGKE